VSSITPSFDPPPPSSDLPLMFLECWSLY